MLSGISVVCNMNNILQAFFSHLKMNDEFEIDLQFGLSMQCFWIIILSTSFGVYYLCVELFQLFWLMVFMFVCSSGLLIYNIKNGRYARILICTGISVQSALVHILVTYYLGNCGTVFFIISAMMIPHLYPLIKTRHIVILDIMLLIVINFTFWISQNITPVYGDIVGNGYRYTLSNIGLAICLMELYVNILSVNELKKLRQVLVDNASKDAYIDALTSLGNRRMFNRYQTALDIEMDSPICIAMIDIDFFKRINDTYGHTVGDRMLVFLADAMKNFFRKSDILIRWGGEEFLVLFRYTELENAETLMERFRIKIQESPVYVDDIQISITVTIGVTDHCNCISLNDSIAIADNLMYQGKSQGRNRVVSLQGRPLGSE